MSKCKIVMGYPESVESNMKQIKLNKIHKIKYKTMNNGK